MQLVVALWGERRRVMILIPLDDEARTAPSWVSIRNFVGWAWYYFLGHISHWRERHTWMNDHGPIQSLQRGMAVIALVVGSLYIVTARGQAGSPLADILDRLPGLFLLPHQWFGFFLSLSSICLLISIYEWPMEEELATRNVIAHGITEARLTHLLFMQLSGHMLALVYWGLTGVILIYSSHLSAGGWGSIAFCLVHRQLYIRNNREYEKERAIMRRSQAKAPAEVAAPASVNPPEDTPGGGGVPGNGGLPGDTITEAKQTGPSEVRAMALPYAFHS